MHPIRRRRLLLLVALTGGVSLSAGLTLYALKSNINLFYSPSQIAADEAPLGHRIRVGGLVVPGSVSRDSNSLAVGFTLSDQAGRVDVTFQGILPDLFREGQGIIALGQLQPGGQLIADEVLAKHDENYMPPEVADSLAHAAAQQAAR